MRTCRSCNNDISDMPKSHFLCSTCYIKEPKQEKNFKFEALSKNYVNNNKFSLPDQFENIIERLDQIEDKINKIYSKIK